MATKQPADIVDLPSDKKDLGKVLRNAIKFGESARNIEAITWGIVRHWLQGIREFTLLDRATGRVTADFSTPGELVVYEEALSAVQQEIGRLSRLSLKPVVKQIGMDLDGVRKGAMGHLFLNVHSPKAGYEVAKRTHDTYVVHYGTAGLTANEGPMLPGRKGEWHPRYEVVPPWELLSLPGDVPAPSAVRAIVRQRWVPLSWLKAYADLSSGGIRPKLTLPSNDSDLYAKGMPLGASSFDFSQYPSGLGQQLIQQIEGGQQIGPAEEGTERYVEINEIMFTNDLVHLDRFIFLVGDYVAGDSNYWKDGTEVWYPMGISRYAEVGGFYGHSFAASKIELNRITEQLLAAVIRNVEDYDAFGLLLVPRTAGVKRHELLRRRDGGPRMATYQPDPVAEDHKPFQIGPVTSGDMPAKVLDLVTKLEDGRVFPQRSIFSADAPRRADAPQSLAFIDNAANESRTPVADQIVSAWNTVHRFMLDAGRRRYTGSRAVLPLSVIDTAIVGVKYDPVLGGVSLETSAIPSPDEVEITVEARTPRDPQTLASHLWQCLQTQIMTPRQFRLEWRKSGVLDLPMSNDAEWAAYMMANLNLIVAFGDGENPGEILDPKGGPPDVHLAVYATFMADARYALASKKVRSKIKELYMAYDSGGYPDDMPHGEDAAMGMEGAGQGGAGLQQMLGMAGAVPGG